eukprot:5430735-Karenia_brevis.AAC.1
MQKQKGRGKGIGAWRGHRCDTSTRHVKACAPVLAGERQSAAAHPIPAWTDVDETAKIAPVQKRSAAALELPSSSSQGVMPKRARVLSLDINPEGVPGFGEALEALSSAERRELKRG